MLRRMYRAAAVVVIGFWSLVWSLGPAAAARAATTPAPVRVLVPDAENLQYLAFWVALGAGYFTDEGLAVRVIPAGAPGAAAAEFTGGAADVAILPPPQYAQAMAQGLPVLAFASLLQNEPANVIVRGDAAAGAGGFAPAVPLMERVRRLRGLRIGVAPGPAARLRALLSAGGVDAERDLQIVSIPGEDQNAALGRREVDALFAHTPYLERALAQQGAVMAVNLSAGEWAPLAGMDIHLLMTTRAYAAAQPAALTSMARAIQRAQRLLHSDESAATAGIMRARILGLDAALVKRMVGLYAPAVPRSPDVSVEGVRRAVAAWGGGAAGGGGAVGGATAGGGPGGGGGGAGSGGAGSGSAPAGAALSAAARPADVPALAVSEYVAPRFAQEAARLPAPSAGALLRSGALAAVPVWILLAGGAALTLALRLLHSGDRRQPV
ncbi:MAG TPA: ABC transporter substrate-binding protein [Chloroflexota bacterium]|nr:ABC transporter substrate-binding protein [Chloroflexota bacterium]